MADETRTEWATTMVTPSEADAIRDAARSERLTVSDFMRRIILDRVEAIAANRPTPAAPVAEIQSRAA